MTNTPIRLRLHNIARLTLAHRGAGHTLRPLQRAAFCRSPARPRSSPAMLARLETHRLRRVARPSRRRGLQTAPRTSVRSQAPERSAAAQLERQAIRKLARGARALEP